MVLILWRTLMSTWSVRFLRDLGVRLQGNRVLTSKGFDVLGNVFVKTPPGEDACGWEE